MDNRLNNAKWLKREYASRTLEAIATETGVSRNTVRNQMIRFGIARRGHGTHFKGRAKPPEQRAKMAATRRKFWAALSPERRRAIGSKVSVGQGGTGTRQTRKVVYVDGRRVLEHRHVAAQKIGRSLLPSEDAHHLDGDWRNNSPGNLTVLPHGKHTQVHKPRKGILKTCANCGAQFYLKPSHVMQRGCSTWCGQQLRRGRAPRPRPQ